MSATLPPRPQRRRSGSRRRANPWDEIAPASPEDGSRLPTVRDGCRAAEPSTSKMYRLMAADQALRGARRSSSSTSNEIPRGHPRVTFGEEARRGWEPAWALRTDDVITSTPSAGHGPRDRQGAEEPSRVHVRRADGGAKTGYKQGPGRLDCTSPDLLPRDSGRQRDRGWAGARPLHVEQPPCVSSARGVRSGGNWPSFR